jgi:hypothetical protein
MRIMIFIALGVCVAALSIAGCVVAITPLSRSGTQLTMGRDGAVIAPQQGSQPNTVDAIPGTTKRDVHDEVLAHYRKCLKGMDQVKDSRPKIKAFTADDVKDKDKLNQELMDYIKEQDKYIADHQQAESTAYQKWKDDCAVLRSQPTQSTTDQSSQDTPH